MSKIQLNDLLGDDSSFTNMSSSERDYFGKLLQEEMLRRESESKPIQIRPILPIEKWVESEYYVGPDVGGIYPYWRDVVIDIFREDRKSEEKINQVVLSGAIGVGKSCLNKKTRIPTSIGLLSLEELNERFHKEGERLQVLAESGWRDCTDVYDNGVDKTKILKLVSGRKVEGTYNHKFRVIRKGKIEWVRSDEVVVGDKFLMTRKEAPFGKRNMDLDKAYTIGYMLGDGWCEKQRVGKRNTGKYDSCCVMYQMEQKSVRERIEKAWKEEFGKLVVYSSTVLKNGNNLVSVRAYGVEKATRLVESGFGSGAGDKDIPKFMYEMEKPVVASFIKGLMDSDGTVGKNGKISITLKSEKLIHNLASLMSMFGMSYTLRVKKVPRYGEFYDLLLINPESYVIYNKEIGFDVDYKKERLEEYVRLITSEGYGRNDKQLVPWGGSELRRVDEVTHLVCDNERRNLNSFRGQENYSLRQLRKLYEFNGEWVKRSEYLGYLCENSVFFDEVVEIGDGECHTMDLTVDKDHSYCFDGFISHNTCAELIMLRKLYEMSCWKNVNARYKLLSKTSIMFLYFSVNKIQAERTGFGEIRSWIDASPYFRENFQRNSRVKEALMFPEGVTFAYGSGSQHSIGMSVIGTIMDEANFMGVNGVGNVEKASELYAGIVNRANSRFIIDGGVNHSLNILISSSTHESSVTERQITASRDDKHTYICAPSQWEVKPDKFSKKFFYVLKGTDYLEPQIVRTTDDVNNFKLSEGLKKTDYVDGLKEFDEIKSVIETLPNHMQEKFLAVPEDLRGGFETNIMKSLQDMGGVSIASSGKLFSSVSVYNGCISPDYKHPFIQESLTISTGDTLEIKDYLRSDFRLKHPERPRYLHIDQSFRTDDTGIACVYVDDIIEDGDGSKKPVFGVDFIIQINPPKPPKKIAIYKIRNFVVFLSSALGMNLGKVTYDIFNSEESRQILEEMGFNVGYQSVDRTDKAYLDTIEIMYEGRLRMYDYPIFRKEIFNVVHDRTRRKVDHPQTNPDGSTGTKDTSDALVGAIENAIGFKVDDSTANRGTLNDFLNINKTGYYSDVNKISVEQMIDRQLDEMIDEMESGLW